MANGVGLVAMRLCFIFVTVILLGLTYIAETTVTGLQKDIQAVSADVRDLTKSFNSFSRITSTQITTDRLDIIRLQDQEVASQDRFNDFVRAESPARKPVTPFRP